MTIDQKSQPLSPKELRERLDQQLESSSEISKETSLPALHDILIGQRSEDIAELLHEFSPDVKRLIFNNLEQAAQAQVLPETDPDSRQQISTPLSLEEHAKLLSIMDPDDATDALNELSEESRNLLLHRLHPETAQDVQELLQYHPQTAGGIMTLDLVSVSPTASAQEVLNVLQETLDTEVVSYVYVVNDKDELIGAVSIREIIAAKPAQLIEEFMTTQLITAGVEDDQEEVAEVARKYNLNSIPVVDKNSKLLGAATVDDLLDVLSEEADEDIYRMAGSPAHHPAQLSILRRAGLRLPWVMLSMISGLVIAYVQKDGPSKDGHSSRLRSSHHN